MSKWYAIKGPDGDWYHGEGVAFETPDAAWSSVANGNPMLLRVMDAEGYRCVEVNLVEPVEPGNGRVYEAVTDWVADLAMRDGGAVFLQATPDARPVPINYGDLRRLLRVAAIAEGVEVNTTTAGGGGEKVAP